MRSGITGGRTVSDNLSTIFDPIGKQLGLRRMRSTVSPNSSVEFDWVALDAKDQDRLTSEPSITLQRVQRDWVRRMIRDNWRWTAITRYEDAQNGASLVANDATDPDQARSRGSFAVSFQEPGEWRVLIESEDQQVAHTVYITARDGRSRTPNPLVVELLPARETVAAGETIPVVVSHLLLGNLFSPWSLTKSTGHKAWPCRAPKPPLISLCQKTPGVASTCWQH